jgi:hypothetical protein
MFSRFNLIIKNKFPQYQVNYQRVKKIYDLAPKGSLNPHQNPTSVFEFIN